VVPGPDVSLQGHHGGLIPFSVVLASEEIYRAFLTAGGCGGAFLHKPQLLRQHPGLRPGLHGAGSFRGGGDPGTGWPGGAVPAGSGWHRSCLRCPHWESTGRSGWWGPWSWWADPGTRAPFSRTCAWERRIARAALDRGVLLRAPGGGGVLPSPLRRLGGGPGGPGGRGPSGRFREVLGSL
jgi:hypothetical protein